MSDGSAVHPQGIISAGSDNGLTCLFSDQGYVDIDVSGYPETTY